MNILVVNGSPLGKKGKTYILQEAFVKGAKKANASVERDLRQQKKDKTVPWMLHMLDQDAREVHHQR